MGTGFFIIIILTSLQLLESTESRVVDYGTTIGKDNIFVNKK